jgi:PAS domain S-box-containing protein
VILVDLGLPDSKGLETALAVRARAKLTPIIIMTVLDDEETALKALQMDIQDYLVKGEINSTVLKRSIRYAIQRKADHEALRLSEQRFASFMLHLPAAAWMKDLQGRYLFANAEAERIFAMPFAEFSGKSDGEFLSQETARQFREHDERVLAEGANLRTTEILRQADGVEHHSIVSKFLVPGPDGQAAYIAGVAFDITERVRMEETLRLSEARFRALHDDNPVMIFTLDAEGTIISTNPACTKQLGYSADELKGQPVLKIFHEDDRTAVAEQLQVCLRNPDQVYRWQFRKIHKDGSLLWVDEIARAIYDLNGVLDALVVCQDITEQKRVGEEIKRLNADLTERAVELEELNRDLETFNYTVAHDLRQPLNVISIYSQAIKEICGDRLDEQCGGFLQETHDSTRRMNRLIEALLNFSSMARAELHKETVDLSAMAHEAAEELKLAEPARRVTFRFADGLSAVGDPNLLRLVFSNLFGNAWKYTGRLQEAVIEFGIAENNGKPAYFIRDNGLGFDMAYADKLFTPFQRLPGAEECRGFGIGLATVERVIRRHNGKVWAEGESGKGATIYFTLGSSESR